MRVRARGAVWFDDLHVAHGVGWLTVSLPGGQLFSRSGGTARSPRRAFLNLVEANGWGIFFNRLCFSEAAKVFIVMQFFLDFYELFIGYNGIFILALFLYNLRTIWDVPRIIGLFNVLIKKLQTLARITDFRSKFSRTAFNTVSTKSRMIFASVGRTLYIIWLKLNSHEYFIRHFVFASKS